MLQRFKFTFLLLTISSVAFSQGATIRGVVYDKADGEPVIYTNVILQGTTMGAQTDDQGIYNISGVPAGTYTIFCTNLGYDSSLISVTVKGNEIINQKFS